MDHFPVNLKHSGVFSLLDLCSDVGRTEKRAVSPIKFDIVCTKLYRVNVNTVSLYVRLM